MSAPIHKPTESVTLSTVRERYSQYALTVRNKCSATLVGELAYLNRLFDFFGAPQAAAEFFIKLDPRTLSEFLLDYALRHGKGSRRNMHCVARNFLRFAYEDGLTLNDLSGLVPAVRKRTLSALPKALPASVISTLQESIDRSCSAGLRDSAIICLLSTYGVRAVQIRTLRLDHIDWQKDVIHFPAAKGGRPIEQYLLPRAGNLLADYISKGRPSSPLPQVFLTLTDNRALPDSRSLTAMIRRRLDNAELSVPKGVSRGTHGFRHAFAVRMTGQVPFKDVVDMLGHRDPSSTLIYAKSDAQTLQQAALPWPGIEGE